MDAILSTSLILFAIIEDLRIKDIKLRVKEPVAGREASGSLDYAIMVLMVRLWASSSPYVQYLPCTALPSFAVVHGLYFFNVLQEVLVMLEAKKINPRDGEGQLLAQMSAVKDLRVGKKRKREQEGHDQVGCGDAHV